MQIDDSWENEQAIDFRRYWNVFRREKWLILGCAIAVALVAASVVRVMTPIYTASATLLIEADRPNVVSIEEVYGLDDRTQQYFETQFAILTARPLAEKVIEREQLLSTPEYNPNRSPSRFNIRNLVASFFPSASAVTPASAEQPLILAVAEYFRHLVIEPVEDTQLVRIHFESADPALAARVANAHAQAYIDSLLDAKLNVTESASTWMTQRLEDMRHALVKSEAELQAFREREQLVDVDGLQSLPSQEITDVSTRLVEVRQALSSAEAAYREITQAGNRGALLAGIPAILDDPGTRAFENNYSTAQRAVVELGKRYGPLHPRMIAAQAEVERARADLYEQRESVGERIRREYEAARSEEASLEAALNSARQEYQNLGRKESELNALQRAVETNRELYDLFYNRVSETAATSDLETAQARIIETAIAPLEPIKPRKGMIIAGSFVGTFVLGLFIAFFSDGLNNTVRSAKDVEERLKQRLLGMVPLLSSKQLKKSKGGAIDVPGYNEAVRTVRTSIMLDNADRPHKVVLVTSAISGEGKSTLALNLAASFAKTGKVMLIDADMRRPSVGQLLDLPRYDAGLSELITKGAPFKSCLSASSIPNLHVIRTGFLPGDPLQLLAHRRMAKILRVLAQYYEHIVIDSPPILPVSDAAVLSKYADTVVFVAKADATAIPQIENGLNLLNRVNAPIAGIVLNGLDTRKAGKYSDFGYGGYYESYTTKTT